MSPSPTQERQDAPDSPDSPPGAPAAAESFEQALATLERIVAEMERGDLPLDEALRQFEAGEALVRRCRDLLDHAEQRVETLLAEQGTERGGGAAD